MTYQIILWTQSKKVVQLKTQEDRGLASSQAFANQSNRRQLREGCEVKILSIWLITLASLTTLTAGKDSSQVHMLIHVSMAIQMPRIVNG